MTAAIEPKQPGPAAPTDEELPVVARLVIEIRSDGARTVARGALEGADHSERVGVEARGGSPAELAAQLLRAIVAAPFQAALSRMTGPPGQVRPARPGLLARLRRLTREAIGGDVEG